MNYYGKDTSANLQHFKYIRKYRKYNKWVYVYADKNTHQELDNQMKEIYKLSDEVEGADDEKFKEIDRQWRKILKQRWHTMKKNDVTRLPQNAIRKGKHIIRKTLKKVSSLKGGQVSASFGEVKVGK